MEIIIVLLGLTESLSPDSRQSRSKTSTQFNARALTSCLNTMNNHVLYIVKKSVKGPVKFFFGQ